MRTKTLLLTAALTAAGIASSMAQVYSVNLVGYINKSLPVGFYMVANQLDNGTGNKLVDLIPNPPDGTFIYKYKLTGGFTVNDYIGGWEGDDLNMTLAPGEGVFIYSPSAQNVTFVGEVKLTSDVNVRSGFNIYSSVIPQSAPLDQLALTPADGTFVYQLKASGAGFKINDYIGGWEGDDNGTAPTPAIGESFYIYSPSQVTWHRSFTVN